MIALLLAATVTVTVVYATTLARDITRQHWANALDVSREGVLAVVGWAAVIIVLSAADDLEAEQASGDSAPTSQGQDMSAASADSVLLAQDRVRRLRVRLADLSAARDRVGSGADPDLDRELATTSARLEQARQWLTSAQSALAAQRTGGTQPPRTGGTQPQQTDGTQPQRTDGTQSQRTDGRTRAGALLPSQQDPQDLLGCIGGDARRQHIRVSFVQVT